MKRNVDCSFTNCGEPALEETVDTLPLCQYHLDKLTGGDSGGAGLEEDGEPSRKQASHSREAGVDEGKTAVGPAERPTPPTRDVMPNILMLVSRPHFLNEKEKEEQEKRDRERTRLKKKRNALKERMEQLCKMELAAIEAKNAAKNASERKKLVDKKEEVSAVRRKTNNLIKKIDEQLEAIPTDPMDAFIKEHTKAKPQEQPWAVAEKVAAKMPVLTPSKAATEMNWMHPGNAPGRNQGDPQPGD